MAQTPPSTTPDPAPVEAPGSKTPRASGAPNSLSRATPATGVRAPISEDLGASDGPGDNAGDNETRPTTAPRRLSTQLARPRGQARFLPHTPRFLRVIGPGLITGAADDDPSGIGTYSQTGAAFGPALLWTALYLFPLMVAVQEMCGRIGLVTGRGLAGVIRRHYDRRILFSVVILLFIANTINVGADLGAMAASIQLLLPWAPTVPLLIVLALGVLALEVFVPYQTYARALKFLALSLLAYVVTGIIIGGDWGRLLQATIIPSIQLNPAYLTLVVAIIGTTISPYLFFWQASEEVEEDEASKRPTPRQGAHRNALLTLKLRMLRLDTVFGMLAAEITFWFIIQTTAGSLHAHNITNIQTAAQAAQALQPLAHGLPYAGLIAKTIFVLGVVGTGLLAVPVLAGSAAYGVAEAFGWREGLSKVVTQARGFYGVIAVSTLLGLVFNFLGINPISALVYAAVINAVVAAPLLGLILLVANNRKIMGAFVNRRLSNIIGLITLVAISIAAVYVIYSLIP